MYLSQMLEIEDLELQKKIMQYLSVGYTSKEIAAEIGDGSDSRTIEYHLEILRKRYQAKNTLMLLAIFFRRKLIK